MCAICSCRIYMSQPGGDLITFQTLSVAMVINPQFCRTWWMKTCAPRGLMSNTALRRVSRYRLSSSVCMVLKRSLKTLLTLRSTLCSDTSRPSLDTWSMKVCRPRISEERRGKSVIKEKQEQRRAQGTATWDVTSGPRRPSAPWGWHLLMLHCAAVGQRKTVWQRCERRC